MQKRIIFITLIIVIFSNLSTAQMWKRHRYEAVGGIGTANFLGDLGGGDTEPARFFGLRDLDYQATRPAFHVAMRYKIFEILALKAGFSYGFIKGDDRFAAEPGRNKRNLSFRSHLLEFGTTFEFYILKDRGKRFISQEPKVMHNLSIYMFGGGGVFLFNPKAKYNGVWYALQPLGTEGQGIPDSGLDRYKRYAFSFPVGIGVKYNVTRRLGIGLEIGNRYTTTDYIDDVSGSYYDNQRIYEYNAELYGEEMGVVAQKLADRHLVDDDETWKPYPSGASHRGGEYYNDAYVFLFINVYYKLTTTRRGLPKF